MAMYKLMTEKQDIIHWFNINVNENIAQAVLMHDMSSISWSHGYTKDNTLKCTLNTNEMQSIQYE